MRQKTTMNDTRRHGATGLVAVPGTAIRHGGIRAISMVAGNARAGTGVAFMGSAAVLRSAQRDRAPQNRALQALPHRFQPFCSGHFDAEFRANCDVFRQSGSSPAWTPRPIKPDTCQWNADGIDLSQPLRRHGM